MLKPISNYLDFKKKFHYKFQSTLNSNGLLKVFIYELIINGAKLYVVGGYLRDIIFNQESRDLDMLIDVNHEKLLSLLNVSGLNYVINRFNGIKIILSNFEVDLWSIEHNWAFENKLVSKNEDYILKNIASGCFYNYDSLVINVLSSNLNVEKFNELINTNELDILQRNKNYKIKNPTIEANILRAFYVRKRFGFSFSQNCLNYIKSRIGYIEDKHGNTLDHLLKFLERYPKYKSLLVKDDIMYYINEVNNDNRTLNLFDK